MTRKTARSDEAMAEKWRGAIRKEYVFYRIMIWGLKIIGLRGCYILSGFVVVFYVLLNSRARSASRNYFLKLGFRDNPLASLVRTWRHFYRFSQILLDRMHVAVAPPDFFKVDYTNKDKFTEMMQSSQGMLVIGSHLGNFELAASLTRVFDKPVYLMMMKVHEERLKLFLDALHQKRSYSVIDLADPLKASQEAVERMKQGAVVCVMGDRELHRKNLNSRFLGHPIKLPLGPFQLASYAGVPVFFVWCLKEKTDRYHVINPGPFPQSVVDNAADRVKAAMQLVDDYMAQVEQIVRKYPYQWFNFYDFWDEPGDPSPGSGEHRKSLDQG